VLVYMLPIGINLAQGRSGKGAALVALHTIAHAVVIRVEQVAIIRVKQLIAGQVRGQHKGFEKPTAVGQVPLGRAHIHDRLHNGVLRLQGLADRHRACPYLLILLL